MSFFFRSEYYWSPDHSPVFGAALVVLMTFTTEIYDWNPEIYDWNPEVRPFQIKATEEYFPVVLFIMQYKVAQSFEFVDEFINCDHSKKAAELYFPVVR